MKAKFILLLPCVFAFTSCTMLSTFLEKVKEMTSSEEESSEKGSSEKGSSSSSEKESGTSVAAHEITFEDFASRVKKMEVGVHTECVVEYISDVETTGGRDYPNGSGSFTCSYQHGYWEVTSEFESDDEYSLASMAAEIIGTIEQKMPLDDFPGDSVGGEFEMTYRFFEEPLSVENHQKGTNVAGNIIQELDTIQTLTITDDAWIGVYNVAMNKSKVTYTNTGEEYTATGYTTFVFNYL